MITKSSHIVSMRSIPKLCSKDIKQFSPSPSLFAVGFICEMIRMHLTKAIFDIVRSRPRITRCRDHQWWSDESLLSFPLAVFWFCPGLNGSWYHGRHRVPLTRQIRGDTGRRSQYSFDVGGRLQGVTQKFSCCLTLQILRVEDLAFRLGSAQHSLT